MRYMIYDGQARYPNPGYPDNAGAPATAPEEPQVNTSASFTYDEAFYQRKIDLRIFSGMRLAAFGSITGII